MKKRYLWLLASSLLVISLLLFSCAETAEEEEEEEEGVVVEEEEEEEEEEEGPPIGGDWWDKLGEPEYGGTITLRSAGAPATAYDPYNWMNFFNGCYDTLFTCDWTLDREIFSFQYAWTPDEYWVGCLVESWEWVDLQTLTINVRQGIRYQDRPPVNGREFTAHDVQFHYDRMLGTGSGFTEPSPFFARFVVAFEKVTAIDNYAAEVKFKNPWPVKNFWTMLDVNTQMIEAREVVEQYGVIDDYKIAVGTGPFMITEFVAGSSITVSRNPNYWGFDERHPQNQLPYVDKIRVLTIGDLSTALAALRTGKLDLLTDLKWQQAGSLERTNPEIEQVGIASGANVVYFRADKGPPADINVRKALQMSLDREALARSHYGGNADPTPYGVIYPVYKEYIFAYENWPQELKDEYSYNPERARELLAEAGYPNGFKTHIITPTDFDLELLQIIKSYFMDIGVDMEITVIDRAALMGIIGSKMQEQMDFSQGGTTHPWIMLENFATWGQNRGTHNDTNFDELVTNFMRAANLEEAKRWSTEADKYTIEKHWALRPAMLRLFNVWQPYIKGYTGEILQSPTSAPTLWYWARLWIDSEMKESMGY